MDKFAGDNLFGSTVRIISGGQTGVDRAALDTALAAGIEISGWCPKGRLAMDGVIPAHYPLIESPSRNYAVRTRLNVRDSDATLILYRGSLTGGTMLTRDLAIEFDKPVSVLDLGHDPNPESIQQWLRDRCVYRLNVAGPREESRPGIYRSAVDLLTGLFQLWP